jgi:cell division protein FtsW (lipid II flippase)
MTRTGELVMSAAAAGLAAFGVTLVNLAGGGTIDAQVGITFLVVLLALGSVHVAVRQWCPGASPLLLPLVGLLAAIGFIEIYRLDRYRAGLQRWWLLIAAATAVGFLFWVRRRGLATLRRYRYIFLLASSVLLMLPLLPSTGPLPLHGLEMNGSRLWVTLDVGFTVLHFQPGELAKLVFIAFLASYLAERQTGLAAKKLSGLVEPRLLLPLVLVWLGSVIVLVVQRDLGASLLLFAAFVAVLYAATGRAAYLGVGGLLFGGGAVMSWVMFDHVQRRVEAWLRPFQVYDDAGFQISQGLFALGTGSLSGSGPGLGRPYLIPNATTDFMFAAVGEEFGLAGSVAVLAAFALLAAVGFGIALRARERYRKLLAGGLAFVIGLQAILIIGGVLRVLPLTGITLPFMSYGGSSLLGNMLGVAVLLRISHEERT